MTIRFTTDNAIEQAKFIIRNSEGYEGMVKAWRTECLNNRATYSMLEGMNERYNEVKATIH